MSQLPSVTRPLSIEFEPVKPIAIEHFPSEPVHGAGTEVDDWAQAQLDARETARTEARLCTAIEVVIIAAAIGGAVYYGFFA